MWVSADTISQQLISVCASTWFAASSLQAQPYFSENLNAGADAAYGPAQLQDRVATAAAAGTALADATAAAVAAAGLSAEEAAEIAAAVAAAAAAAGLVPTGPESLAAAAVAAEAAAPFYKGTAAGRQATAVAMGPDGFAALLAKVWVVLLAMGKLGCVAFECRQQQLVGGGVVVHDLLWV
jgi:hypothetical protein